MPAGLPPTAADFLDRHHVMTLATCGPDGPWAAAVFYANEGGTLYFVSSPASRHCRNLALVARCSATIQEDCADWTQIKGVQLEGQVSELQGDDADQARQRYGIKFPIVGRLAGAPAAIVAALAKVRWYRLQAERLYVIDNSLGFGHREEIAVERD